MAVREVDGHLDPFPAFGGDLLGLGRQLLGGQAIEQGYILQPAASVLLEQVAQDHAARCLVSIETDKLRTAVRRAHGALGQPAADQVRLLIIGLLQCLPDLLLPGMVAGNGERHELLQSYAVLSIDPEQLLGDRGQPQPLLNHGRRDEEAGGDLLLADALLAQHLEGAELIQRMQGDTLDILGQRILLR